MTGVARVRLAVLACVLLVSRAASGADVDPRIIDDLNARGSALFLVLLRAQPPVAAVGVQDREALGRAVYASLRLTAERSQADLIATLAGLGASYRPFWVANAIAVEGGRDVVEALAARADVLALESDRPFRVPIDAVPPVSTTHRVTMALTSGIEWNVSKVNAPAAWALGYTGQGGIFASADTGVQWDHPALKANYAGWNGTTADHNYHWWDAVKSQIGPTPSSCGYNTQAPCDDNGHGTGTTGTAVGTDGASNRIGVAPGAKWIACRNMDAGNGRPTTYLGCLEFFLAPTDLTGANPDPSRRPDVIGNSYTCPASEQCSPLTFRAAIENLRAAGVLVVAGASNQGPGCSTVSDPPAIDDASTTVGSVDANDVIVNSSSRGPVEIDGSHRRKPDLVAPGVSVRTAVRGGSYSVYGGTSFAAPHVAGAALLLWSALPSLRRDPDATEARLEQTAVALITALGCGGDTPTQVPNNVYGYGRVDVLAAIGGQVDPPTITSVSPATGPSAGGTTISITGTNFVADLTDVALGGTAATGIVVSSATTLTAVTSARGAGVVAVSVTTPAGTASLPAAFTYTPPPTLTVLKSGSGTGTVTSLTPPVAINCGGLCSAPFPHGTVVTLRALADTGAGFMGWSGGGCSGTGNCVVTMTSPQTVSATFAVGGVFTRYLAEGATSPFFDTRLALLNPGSIATTATLTFLRSGSTAVVSSVPVPARTRVTVDPKTIPGVAAAEFSTKVESAQPLIVDRTLSWDVGHAYGAHAETSVEAPALTWYLAEGATHSGFSLFYLLQNPNASEAQVRVRFLRPSGAPLEKSYPLPPNSRNNIWVNEEDFPGLGKALAATDVSAVIDSTNGQPIIVERALYLDLPGQTFGAGHESAGVTAPATEWFLAEGNTGDYFDLFVLIANPGNADAQVEATYLLPDGSTIAKPYIVAANSRFNIWVDGEDARLANTAVSTTIRSTNGVPVIVERALWWPGGYGQWYEAHNSPGATSTGTRWALAEGEVGGARGVETYILLANTSPTAGNVKVTLLFEDGTSAERTFPVTANSRFNVDARAEFPAALDRRFGAIVESQGPSPAQIVVERAMYWSALGQNWAAGTNALATKLQ